MVCLFAEEILQIWLGADFVTESTIALQLLAVGVLVNSLAYAPFALLQGIGRPDLPAKFHLIELPVYIIVVWLMVSHYGISGAAAAWTLRAALDTLLLFWATFMICDFPHRILEANGAILAGISLLILAGAGYGIKTVAADLSIYSQFLIMILLLILFAWVVWGRVLDGSDRGAVLNMMSSREDWRS